MHTSHSRISLSLKLPLLSLIVVGTLGLSACSDQSAKDKEAATEEATVVDSMKKNATDAKNASADMLDKAKEMGKDTADGAGDMVSAGKDKAAAYGTAAADKAAEYKDSAVSKAGEYKDAATDKLAAGKDKLADLKATGMDKKSDAEALLEKAKEKATDGDGGN